MNYWLMKSEPDAFSIDDLRSRGADGEPWDGVRNYQARNFMWHDMSVGDRVLFYHSSCKDVGVAGIAEIISEAVPDESQFNPESPYYDPKATADKPRWYLRQVRFVEKFPTIIPLALLKKQSALVDMALLKRGRLSVSPVTESEWHAVLSLS
ncbi:EVE domain-containing protein [Salinispirillum sp. LH 10-3-1]|uniref:EVE domain-containing protein n=1 Tax=Salinispirillum sp. LH 10-3-1 TaxID=2952525 RepID=A0AB38YGV2_9GAMM